MTFTIYVDVLFLLNLIIDYIIIASTAFISGAACKSYRLIGAAVFGAIYSTVIFFPQLKILNVVIFKIVASIIIILIAFKYTSITAHIKLIFTYYIINFIYGGGMYAFYRFTSLGSKMNFSNGEYYIDIPLGMIIALAVFFYFIIKLFGRILDTRYVKNSIVELSITANGKSVSVNALIDTGNELYDPISMLPVIIAEKQILRKIITIDKSDDSLYRSIREYGMRIIPYKDASGNQSMFYAFKPQSIIDVKRNKPMRPMLVAITDCRLCSDGTYNALLHSKSYLKG